MVAILTGRQILDDSLQIRGFIVWLHGIPGYSAEIICDQNTLYRNR